MKKLNQITIREISNLTIIEKDGAFNLSGQEIKSITLTENPFFHIMSRMEGRAIENGMEIPWIVKVVFPSQKFVEAQCNKALVIDGEYYSFYLSTPAGMKNLSAFYIKNAIMPYIEKFENIISTGKLDKIWGKEIGINKDITSRISLNFSGCHKTSIKPRFIILPSTEYKNIQDIRCFENSKLVVKKNYELTSEPWDGCGLASPELFKQIAEELNIRHIPSFATIRSPKMAVKGLLSNVDFMSYFRDKYQGDTEYFKKKDGNFYIRDVFGDLQLVDENSILIPKSMAKWSHDKEGKWYASTTEYDALKDPAYEDLTDCLYVIKTSKKKLENISTTSYQLLGQLALTWDEMHQLSTPTKDMLYGVANYKQEYVLRFLNALSNCSTGDDEDIITPENINLSDKISYLLTVDYNKFIKMSWIKKALNKMIMNQVKALGAGKFFIKETNFKAMVSDPLSFLHYCIHRDLNSTIALNSNEFYIKGEIGSRLISRYPIASFSEIGVKELVTNESYDKYCNYSNEILVFNSRDISATLLSGADFDGDFCLVSDNEILKTSVIPPQDGIHFIHTEDGDTAKMLYTWHNRLKAQTNPMGNLIGKIAITNASISSKAQELGFLVDGQHLRWVDIFKKHTTTEEQLTEDKRNEIIQATVNSYPAIVSLDNQTIKRFIQEGFYNLQEDMYNTVRLSMSAIDAPKTLIFPSEEEVEKVIGKYRKKPSYFWFLDKGYEGSDLHYRNNVLCFYANHIVADRLYKVVTDNIKKNGYEKDNILLTIFAPASIFQVDINTASQCSYELLEGFKKYDSIVKELIKKKRLIEEIEDENGVIVDFYYKQEVKDGKCHYVLLDKHSQEEKKKLFEEAIQVAEFTSLSIHKNYSQEEICKSIALLLTSNYTHIQKFICDYFFDSIEYMCKGIYNKLEHLVEDDNGTEILFGKFSIKKSTVELSSFNFGTADLQRFEKKVLDGSDLIKCRYAGIELGEYVEVKIIDMKAYIYNHKGQEIGVVFDNSLTTANLNLLSMDGAKLKLARFEPKSKSIYLIVTEIL